MANTRKHKMLGRWNNGFQDHIPNRLQRYWDRANGDKGRSRAKRMKLREKIMNNLVKILTDK